ncbi:hydrogenase nickel incorporation protein HypB [Parageobacillus thermoglucosidasius]|uniref:hydrogenase nickel incorporation protein HypB n=1 Tax=Parageobacillus thermoglucosidasius TaxID=1426 RepID=UPI002E224574|nr:hydrogenase nickel incorporation protein HypB [Parageobacillus thermoglucosidasius]MED4904707.1 hydrogenase nickel incorporation protein HypB [Parageobacillus thermoglucosidasius]MED4913731.1 hydrogenase nickel incorporation protein HypB [Parageobacillus thermoglucosidasius]MED4944873.1 hydrogenase nickel incorporation protein HypB [Parageobacillus thermoglucosidasius]MED4982798.1 hydrogenase nickel incorporation protein HypB [Parageobacillus thermoglucosidasius]
MKVALEVDVLTNNNRAAEFNRRLFEETKTLVINLMSSPGAGKTTILEKTIEALAKDFRIGVIEGDLATDKDAERIRSLGAQAVQINTHGGCHLDARMIAAVLPQFDFNEIDLLFIENVGNLVCPSGYDLGQQHKVAVLSVPEGNDKILKYPTMFMRTELVLLNKIDLLPYLDFDVGQAKDDLKGVNPQSSLIPLSAKTNEGMDQWFQWIREGIARCKNQ